MRFNLIPFAGGALLCGALLAACAGGGGTGGGPGTTIPAPAAGGSGSAKTTRVVVTIRSRGAHAHGTRRKRATKRREYVSTGAQGLQLSVTSGSTTQTVYADLSSTSTLCTTTGNVRTCTISVPTLGAQETFTALETDQAPLNATNGYGTGFSGTTNILAAISQSENLSSQLGGPVTIGLNLGPVVAFFYDCTGAWTPPPTLSIPAQASANFGDDGTGFNDTGGGTNGGRIVVTAGVAVSGSILANFCDPSDGYEDYAPSPAPFVDVDASPVPLTVTSNASQVTLAALADNATPPPSSAYAASASIPTDAYYWDNIYFLVGINVASTYPSTSAATIVFNNNLTAVNPFTNQTVNQAFPGSMTYYVAAISASSYSFPSVAANGTATVTGTDEGAYSGMDAESAYNAADENCNDGSGTTLATVAPSGPISSSNWQQAFTISAGSTAGTCTFYLYDTKAGTVTQPISVTVL